MTTRGRPAVAVVIALAGAVALCGCYEVPGVEPEEVISVSVDPGSAPADGARSVEITVSLHADAALSSAVTITTSAGVVNPAVSGDAARTLVIKLPRSADEDGDGRKAKIVAMRVPRTTGVATVTAAVGDVSASATLLLEAQPPTRMISEGSVSVLEANGTARAEIAVSLLADAPSSVSLGTRIASRVCCSDSSSGAARPVACTAPPPLRVPAVVELVSGSAVSFAAVTEPLRGVEELDLWVLSRVAAGGAPDPGPCASPDGVTSSAVPLRVKPML